MTFAPVALPSDPAELRAFAELLQAEVYAKTLHIEKLKAQLALLRRARFGRSSEKLDRDIEQLELMIGGIEEDQGESLERDKTSEPSAARQQAERSVPARRPLPAHLPRERIEHE